MRRSRKLRKQQFQSFRDRLRSKKQTSRSKSTSKCQAGPKQIRHRESGILYVLNPDGSLRRGEVTDSSWWVNYVILPEELLTSRLKKTFRDRFRMPYSEWKKFVDKLNEHELFSRWKRVRLMLLVNHAVLLSYLLLEFSRSLEESAHLMILKKSHLFQRKFIDYSSRSSLIW